MSGPPDLLPEPPAAWADLPFFSEAWPAIRTRLEGEPGWLPGPAGLFRALELTAPAAVRVVILGQDPYPAPGRATGLAFGFPPGETPRDSLRNILREVEADLGRRPADPTLEGWARQGVLLLNTALSVPPGRAGGHRGLGWERLAGEVLARVAQRPTAFLLWGAAAQRAAAPHLGDPRHLVVTSAHPSPLSAHRGFLGSRPFGRVNAWAAARGEPGVDWAA